MKGLFVTAVLIASSFGCVTTADAYDGQHKGRPYTTFKVLRPVDVARGVGCFCKEATKKAVDGVGTVLKGTGEIITAPFKSRLRLPQMRHYRWYRGHWHEVKPRNDAGTPVETETQYIPVPFVDPAVRDTIVFYERKF